METPCAVSLRQVHTFQFVALAINVFIELTVSPSAIDAAKIVIIRAKRAGTLTLWRHWHEGNHGGDVD